MLGDWKDYCEWKHCRDRSDLRYCGVEFCSRHWGQLCDDGENNPLAMHELMLEKTTGVPASIIDRPCVVLKVKDHGPITTVLDDQANETKRAEAYFDPCAEGMPPAIDSDIGGI